MKSLLYLTIFFFFPINLAQALPIDWHGVLGFDTTNINNYRRIEKGTDNSSFGNANNRGTQEIPLGPGDNGDADWQSTIFRLEPVLIINDAATIKGELTSGYARGGFFGEDSSQSQEPGFGNVLYQYNFSSGNNSIVLNKLYTELYSDTATYIIGRHSAHYGLGAIVNGGENTWDRHSFTRDGITIKVKIGNFGIEPFWARQGSNGSLTESTRTKEIGFTLIYDNIEKDLSFGLLYSIKKSAPSASDYTADPSADLPNPNTGSYNYPSLGKTDIKITDLFLRKKIGPFSLGVEVPIISGDVGATFNSNTGYKAKAIIAESQLDIANNITLSLDAGKVAGDNGSASNFEALYLNPNYQIANLLFRYNLRAISHPTGENARSVYDSYIHNTTYIKFGLSYQTGNWTWDTAFIWAQAEESAQAGEFAYNHLTNKRFLATTTQEKNLGYEIDLNFNYLWNNEITIGGAFGYLITGNYFEYTNSTNKNKVDNSFIMQLNTAITF